MVTIVVLFYFFYILFNKIVRLMKVVLFFRLCSLQPNLTSLSITCFFRFFTKGGRTLCVSHPSEQAWVRRRIEHLEKNKGAAITQVSYNNKKKPCCIQKKVSYSTVEMSFALWFIVVIPFLQV